MHLRTAALARAILACASRALRTMAALALCVPGAALAWGPVGHQVVGAVADELLTPGARAAVADLLADDRDATGARSGRTTLAQVADWPDEIRGTPHDRPRWHYDNRPVCGSAAPATAWCARGECASAQLAAQLAVLADPRRSRAERNTALKWVVHLVGDLHQPLHAADLAEGANRIRVVPAGRRGRREESLHAYWDSHLVNLALRPRGGAVPDATLDGLRARARGLEAAAVQAPPERWAQESNAIARSFALDLPGIDCALAGGARGGEPEVALPRGYVARARQVVEERLVLAGARLAGVLNPALDPRR